MCNGSSPTKFVSYLARALPADRHRRFALHRTSAPSLSRLSPLSPHEHPPQQIQRTRGHRLRRTEDAAFGGRNAARGTARGGAPAGSRIPRGGPTSGSFFALCSPSTARVLTERRRPGIDPVDGGTLRSLGRRRERGRGAARRGAPKNRYCAREDFVGSGRAPVGFLRGRSGRCTADALRYTPALPSQNVSSRANYQSSVPTTSRQISPTVPNCNCLFRRRNLWLSRARDMKKVALVLATTKKHVHVVNINDVLQLIKLNVLPKLTELNLHSHCLCEHYLM